MFENVTTYHQCDVCKTSLHTINVMSHPKELRKEALSIVHNHAFLLLLPMKENELPNSPTKKPMECLEKGFQCCCTALTNTQLFNLTLENTGHFINTLKEN